MFCTINHLYDAAGLFSRVRKESRRRRGAAAFLDHDTVIAVRVDLPKALKRICMMKLK